MRVSNRFQISQALSKLPNDFKVIKVDIESLKDHTVKRLCRDIEKQLNLQPAQIYDRIGYEEHLKQILTDELFETDDLDRQLVVLGNKSGVLSGRYFNQTDFRKRLIDHTQFGDRYPIFEDTSTVIQLDSGKVSDDLKRERAEETFSVHPEPQRPRAETFYDIQSAWAVQETDFRRQIDDLKAKYHNAMEQNVHLAEQAAGNQQNYENSIAQLKSKVRDLEVTMMEQDYRTADGPEEDVREPSPEDGGLNVKMEDFQNVTQQRPAQLAGLSESIMEQDSENRIEYAKKMIDELDLKNQSLLAGKWTLSQIGMTVWNPNTTSFLDYLISFRAVLNVSNVPTPKAIQLLFSALPSKYSYLRGIAPRHKDYDSNDYFKVESILIKMIVGGQEKIFTDFVNLQKKSHENFLEYFQKICDFYLFSYSTARKPERDTMDNDSMAFKLVKDKMVKAYPNRLVPEFKRRLETKTTLTDIFEVILEMNDQFPETENEKDYSVPDLNVLKTMKNSDWKKNVKCYHCGKKGHLKKKCYKRESKTKKTGSTK